MRWLPLMMATFALLGSKATAAPAFTLPPPVQVPPLAAGLTAQSVAFVRAAFQIPEGKVWAYDGASVLTCALAPTAMINPDPVRWKAADWTPDGARLTAMFREELVSAAFARSSTVNLFESGPTAERYHVAALIVDMDARFCGTYERRPVSFNGRMRMAVEWQVFDTLARQVVARIATIGGGEEGKPTTDGIERVFMAAFRQNARALLATEEFRTLVTSAPANATPVLASLAFRPALLEKRQMSSAAEAVAAVFAGDSMGTGFLLSPEGYVLTNHHVVGRARYVKVRWSDGAETVGEVLRSDARRDVAVIKTDAGRRSPLALRGSTATLGEAVYAIGTPLDAKFQGSVTKGIVSATRTYEGLPYIQSDVTVNQGNSGGPLLDENGAVIGVTVWGVDISGAPVGINLFIPIDEALKALALTPAA